MSFPLAIDLSSVTSQTFVVGVVVVAGIYALVALGLQLNVGYTGISNFGAAGFMAIGAYTMGILVVKVGLSFWFAFPLAVLAAILFGLLIGLPSLRLRADYFAIATLAMAEVVRLFAQNANSLTGGNQGLFCDLSGGNGCFNDAWTKVADHINTFLGNLGWSGTSSGSGLASWNGPNNLFPLLIVVWASVLVLTVGLIYITRSPWGRVLRAIREDEDAARALGKNALSYKLQSLAIAGAIGAIAGTFYALELTTIHPLDFQPLFTFFAFGVLILGGLTSYWGVPLAAILLMVIIEGTRYVDLGLSEPRVAALRFALVGLILILLMALRPQGMFGKREEMVLGE
jgi:branched-chain amino acid transport system permease protein